MNRNIKYNINERQSSTDRATQKAGSAVWNGTKAVGRGLSFGVSGVWNALMRGSDKALDRIINEFTLMMIYGQQPKKSFLRRVWDNIRKKGNLVRAVSIPGESKATMLDDINRCMAEVYNMYFRGEVTLEQIQGSFTGLGINTTLTMSSDINTIGKFIFGENVINESDFSINVNDIKNRKTYSEYNNDNNIIPQYNEDGEDEDEDENNIVIPVNPHNAPTPNPIPIPETKEISDDIKDKFNNLITKVLHDKVILYNNLNNYDNNCRRHIRAYLNSMDLDEAKQKLSSELTKENNKIVSEFISDTLNCIKTSRESFNNFEAFINKHPELKEYTKIFESEDNKTNIDIEQIKENLKKVSVSYTNNIILAYKEYEYKETIEYMSTSNYVLLQYYFNLLVNSFIDTDVELYLNINLDKDKNIQTSLGIKKYEEIVFVDENNEVTTDDVFEDLDEIIKRVEINGKSTYTVKIKDANGIKGYLSALNIKYKEDIEALCKAYGIEQIFLDVPIKNESKKEFYKTLLNINNDIKTHMNKFFKGVEKVMSANKITSKEFDEIQTLYTNVEKFVDATFNSKKELLAKKLVENPAPENPDDDENILVKPEPEEEKELEEPEENKDEIDPQIKALYKEEITPIRMIDYIFGNIFDTRGESMNLLKYYALTGYNIDNENDLEQLYISIYNSVIAYFNPDELFTSNIRSKLFTSNIKTFLNNNKDIIRKQTIKVINIVDDKTKKLTDNDKKKITMKVVGIIKEQLKELQEQLYIINKAEGKLKSLIGKKINKDFNSYLKVIKKEHDEQKQAEMIKKLIDDTFAKIDKLNLTKVKEVFYKDLENIVNKEVTDDIIIFHYNLIKNEYKNQCYSIFKSDNNDSDNIEDDENKQKDEKPDIETEHKQKDENIFSKFENIVEILFGDNTDENTNNIKQPDRLFKWRKNYINKFLNIKNQGIGRNSNTNDKNRVENWNNLENKKELIQSRDKKETSYKESRKDDNNTYQMGKIATFIANKLIHAKNNIKTAIEKKGKDLMYDKTPNKKSTYESLTESDIIRVKRLRKQHGGMLNNYISESEFNNLDTLQLLENYHTDNFDKKVISDERMIEMCLLYETSPMEESICERLKDIFTKEDMEILENVNEDLGLSKPINEIGNNNSNAVLNTDALFNIDFSTNEIKANKESYDISDLHRLISLGGAFADNYLNKSFSKLVTDMLKTVNEIAGDRDEIQNQMRSFIGNFMNMIDAGQDDDNITRMFLGGGGLKATNTGQGTYMKRVDKIADKIINSGDKYIKAVGAKYKKKFTKHEVEEFNDFRLTSAWEAKKIILQRGANSIFESLYYMPAWGTALKFYFNYYPIAIYLVTSALANGDGRSVPENALQNAQSILTTKNY